MMGWGGYGGYNMMAGWGLFGLLTWLLLIVFLATGIVYFWKGIKKGK